MIENIELKIKKMKENAIIPKRQTDGSAGMDLYACIDERIEIPPHTHMLVGIGVSMTIPRGYFGAIFARSGLALKRSLAPGNGVGVIDCDFTDEVKVILHNYSDVNQYIEPNERIAQLVLIPYLSCDIGIVEQLNETERTGGFGSSGRF